MPSPEPKTPRPSDAGADYFYRRRLRTHEMIPAIGIAVGAGLVAFYVARLLLQRTPLVAPRPPQTRSHGLERSADA